MQPEDILAFLDFVPHPMVFTRSSDGYHVAFCELHRWTYASGLAHIADAMLKEHLEKENHAVLEV